MRSLYILFILLLSNVSFAQYQGQVYQYNGEGVPVYVGSQAKSTPWCGGFDNPQLTMGDLNNDGKNDLVVFERFPGLVKTFINTGTAGSPYYVYRPNYVLNFPGTGEYLILADYNNDGISDLFTHNGTYGFTVYKGYFNANNELCFNFYKVLVYNNDSIANFNYVDAYVKNQDVPCIIDIDGDTDLDFFAYQADGSEIYFYKNYQVEDGLPADSISIKLRDKCWGKKKHGLSWVREHVMPYSCVLLNSLLFRTAGGGRDGSNAICIFKADGDDDYDLLDGNSNHADLQFFRNGKLNFNDIDSFTYQDTIWQQYNLTRYPSPYWLDIDLDGKKDILVTPHDEGDSENYKTISLFKNTGTVNAPVYTFVSDTFLVDQAIDIGSGSYPTLYDYDKDGKPDLIVGSEGYFQNGIFRSRLSYYKNTSSGPGSPAFTFQTADFLRLDTMNLEGAAPSIGDLDNDGKDDLIVGQKDGTLTLYKNFAASNSVQPIWKNPVKKIRDKDNFVIDVGSHATPCMYDLDKDGKPDLVIGNMVGNFVYYQNVSTVPGSMKLKEVNLKVGGAKVDLARTYSGFSTPFIGKMDNINDDYLLSGSYTGRLHRFTGFQSGDTTATYTMIDSVYSYINGHGMRTAPTVADIDGDGKYDMIVGNSFGGLMMYRQWVNVSISEKERTAFSNELKLYPNPAGNTLGIQWASNRTQQLVEISIVNIMGQTVLSATNLLQGNMTSVDISSLAPGTYLCIIRSGSAKVVKPFSVVK